MGTVPADGLLGDGDPGAVDGAVESPELDGRSDGRLYAVLVGDVGLDEPGVGSGVSLEVGDYHVRAGALEHSGGGGAEA